MLRLAHGSTLSAKVGSANGGNNVQGVPFDFLFPDLQKPECLLAPGPQTLTNLSRLGISMSEKSSVLHNSSIPAAYTYLGQFIDHDISRTRVIRDEGDTISDSCMLASETLKPWCRDEINKRLENKRLVSLQLDAVYGSGPGVARQGKELVLGTVSLSGNRLDGKDDYNDVLREPKDENAPRRDRAAKIGDPRNDQTVMLSQLHVAFLRAHNAIVRKQDCSFQDARTQLVQHFHWLIIHDFLKAQIADPDTVDKVLKSSSPSYDLATRAFLPLEFTAAAFRFGHSMVRSTYYLNFNYAHASLKYLFTLRAMSHGKPPKPGVGFDTLPEDRIIDWRAFISGGLNVALKLDTRMVEPLDLILDENERPVDCETRLAVLDLRRGYMMSLPYGQAVAKKLEIEPLTADQVTAAAKDNLHQLAVLKHSEFREHTPLWFYILAEAALTGGNRLGKLGSRLVAEVLIGLVRNSPNSILDGNWSPYLGPVKGKFDLPDLLALANLLKAQ